MGNIVIGIVILNYNTAEDVQNAISSICNFTHVSYKICVVDNNSSFEDREKLNGLKSQHVDILLLNENRGYGSGNNEGVKFLQEKYAPQYLLIMNPDVTIIEDNTIDDLINKLQTNHDNHVCGVQPLVWTPRFGGEANKQINIRSLMTYWDCCISSFHILGAIFKQNSSRMVYRDDMPYVHDIVYEVPSGCFFIVNSDLFKEIDYFDHKTFLYNEEMIVGYKFDQIGYKFLLSVDHKVLHEQGVSTGERRNKVSGFVKKCQKQSLNVYMRDYLKVGRFKVMFVDMLIELNYIGKYIKYNVLKKK